MNIHKSWQKVLKDEFQKNYFKELMSFIKDERTTKDIFPQDKDTFNAFLYTSLNTVKVVIIGQDPYHGENQAHGLSFSIKDGKLPPSLKNIYKELNRDLGIEAATTGDLTKWAEQGVLLLNSVLTVEKQTPGSHRKKGWETFTDKVIEILNEKQSLVFILWGNDAKKKGQFIDRSKHLVLESAHPSPFSVKNFTGNSHFSKTNAYLKEKGIKPIRWDLK